MINKRMLFLETPPMSADFDNPWIFRKLGFDVDHKSFLGDLLEKTDNLKLFEYDVIVLCIEAAAKPFAKKAVMDFRKRIDEAEKKKGSSVFLVGVNLNIKEEDIETQLEVYDDLFLPGLPINMGIKKDGFHYAFTNQGVSYERMQEILERILVRKLITNELAIMQETFPIEKKLNK